MERLYEYEDRDFHFHHTRTVHPDPDSSAFRLQLHDKYELYYFLSGHGSFIVEGHAYNLRPGTVLILRSGEAHSLHIRTDLPYERMTLLFSPHCLDDLEGADALLAPYRNRQLGQNNCFLPGDFSSAFVKTCMENMISASTEPSEQRLAILSQLPAVLNALRLAFLLPRHEEQEIPGIAGEIAQYINDHLSDPWDLTTLEAALHRNKDYLNRKFKEAMGSSIWEYTIHKRISVSQEKIREGMPIDQVFETSGFHDYSTFYRGYKSVTGKAPSEDGRE